MTNFEYYKNEIGLELKKEVSGSDLGFAFDKEKGKIVGCTLFQCNKCLFDHKKGVEDNCAYKKFEWGMKEYTDLYKLTKFDYDCIKLMCDSGYIWARNYELLDSASIEFAKGKCDNKAITMDHSFPFYKSFAFMRPKKMNEWVNLEEVLKNSIIIEDNETEKDNNQKRRSKNDGF